MVCPYFTVIFGAEPLLGPKAGIGTYSWALYQGIRRQRPELPLHLVANGRLLEPADCAPNAAARSRWPAAIEPLRRGLHRLPGYISLRQRMLGHSPQSPYRRWRALSRRPPAGSLYHEPNFLLRPFNGPCIATIHDLGWLRYPQTLKSETRALMERGMPSTLERADLLLTVSHFVRDELVQQLGIAPERIRVTPNGVDPCFRPRSAAETQASLQRHQLRHGGYLLAVATPEPRKNLPALVQAFANLPLALQQRYPLVLVGGHGWGEALTAAAEPLQRRGHLRRLGYVADAELPALYAGARGFALPSLYEGFGLPVLEALASGVPVLTSAQSAMAEIVDGTARLVDPQDTDAISSGLRQLLEADAECQQARAAGCQRAARYHWNETVARTLAAYAEVFGLARSVSGLISVKTEL